MSTPERKIEIVIGGDASGAGKAFDEGVDGSSRLGDALGKMGKVAVIGGAAVGAAAIGAGAALFKLGGDFDEQFDKIRVNTGSMGPELDGLKGSFKNVFASVPTDMESAGTAISTLNQKLDLTGKPLEDLSAQFLNLSRITGEDLAGSMDSVAGLFNNFGISAADQPKKLDELYRASQATGIGVTDLAGKLATGGVTLRQLGFSFTESTALIAGLAKAGLDAGDVMPALGKAMAVAAKEGKSASTLLDETFAKIKAAPNDTAAAGVALELFGAKAGPKMAALIREGKLSLSDLQAQIAGGKDTINGAAADTADFAEKWNVFKNKILVGLEPLATGVFNAVGGAMEAMGPIADKVIGFFQGLGQDSSFANFGASVTSVMEQVKAVVGQALAAVGAFWAEHGAQITATLAELAATVSSAFGAIKAIFDTWVAVVSELWDRFGNTLLDKLRIQFNAIVLVVKGAFEILSGIFDLIKAVLTGKWGEAWEAVKKIFSGAWDVIVGLLKAALNGLSTLFELAKAAISAAWSAVWNAVKTLFSDIWGGIKSGVKGGLDDVVGFFTGMPSRIAGAAGGMWDGIVSGFKGAINTIIRGWNNLEFKVPGFSVGPVKFGGFTLGMPNIPYLAKGTNDFIGGLAIVGEKGPELVNLPRHSQVVPNNRLGNLGAGGGNVTVQVDVHVAKATDLTEREWYDIGLKARRIVGPLGLG